MNRKRALRLLVVAVVTAAIAIAVTYTAKVFAGVQVPYGTINAHAGDWQKKPLPASECPGIGGGGSECYRILTCGPAAPKCDCTEPGEWH
jgi:hypothetical protein